MIDIFISYRRKDGEAFAYLLYKDLVKDGYSVFFDQNSLGGGDYRQKISELLMNVMTLLLFYPRRPFQIK